MKVNYAPRIWEFDVDNTLIQWNLSDFPDEPKIQMLHTKGTVDLVVNQKNVNLLKKLSKIGWYIRVHSGSGAEWAERVVYELGLAHYVDSVEAKALGKTDDQPPGDGYAYFAYRDPKTGKEA